MSQFKTLEISPVVSKLNLRFTPEQTGITIHSIEIPFLSKISQTILSAYLANVTITFRWSSATGMTGSFTHPVRIMPTQDDYIFIVDKYIPLHYQVNGSTAPGFFNSLDIELVAPGKTKEFIAYIIYDA